MVSSLSACLRAEKSQIGYFKNKLIYDTQDKLKNVIKKEEYSKSFSCTSSVRHSKKPTIQRSWKTKLQSKIETY